MLMEEAVALTNLPAVTDLHRQQSIRLSVIAGARKTASLSGAYSS